MDVEVEKVPYLMTGKQYTKRQDKLAKQENASNAPESPKVTKTKKPRKTYFVNGVEYKTLDEVGALIGLTGGAICKRCRSWDCSVEQAVNMSSNRGIKITLDGIPFKTLTAACEAFDISPSSVMHYAYRHGITSKESLTHFHGRMYRPKKGVSYRCVSDALKEYGVSLKTYRKRINQGMSEWKALTLDHHHGNDRKINRKSPIIIIRNLKFKSANAFVTYFQYSGVLKNNISSRILDGECDFEKAVLPAITVLGERCGIIDVDTLHYKDKSKIPKGAEPEYL